MSDVFVVTGILKSSLCLCEANAGTDLDSFRIWFYSSKYVSGDMMDGKLIIFGLDGACFDLIDDWLEAGALPTLAGLIDRGGTADLQSCTPATTPPAWSSLTTGVNPGKHGVFGFYRRVPDSYAVQPVSDRDVRANRLWDYASAEDLTSLVVNVPVTHPGRELDGAIVPGYLSPDDLETHPEDVLSTVGMEDYRVYAPSEADDVPEDQLLSEWLELTESRRDLSLRLMNTTRSHCNSCIGTETVSNECRFTAR
jgi:predicted AlkP superfamily phosphohydrolase/phosphomutase